MSKLYTDVITHDIYKILTADLPEDQRESLDKVMQEFTARIESGLLYPLGGMASNAMDKSYQEAYDAAVADGTIVRESTGRPDAAPEGAADTVNKPQQEDLDEEDQEEVSDG